MMDKLYLDLKGRTPLLMNNPKETMGKKEEEVEEGVKGPVKLPDPKEQAEVRRYLLPNGNFYMPATAVRKCLLTASVGYTAKAEGRKAAVRPILSGAVILSDEAFPLLDEEGQPIPGENYEVDIQRVTIRAARASLWRGRPRIWPWGVVAWFNFDSRRIGVDLVETIAREGGIYPGLLDYRPEKGGWFGTYELVKVWTE